MPVEQPHSRLVTEVLGVDNNILSELHMVQDSSVDFQDTWDFLSRRMEDSAALAQARKQVSVRVHNFTGRKLCCNAIIWGSPGESPLRSALCAIVYSVSRKP